MFSFQLFFWGVSFWLKIYNFMISYSYFSQMHESSKYDKIQDGVDVNITVFLHIRNSNSWLLNS